MAICTNSANNQLLRPLIKVNQVGSTGGSSPSCVLVEGFSANNCGWASSYEQHTPLSWLFTHQLCSEKWHLHVTFHFFGCTQMFSGPRRTRWPAATRAKWFWWWMRCFRRKKVPEKRFFAGRFPLCALTPTCRAGVFCDPMPTKDVGPCWPQTHYPS